MSTAELLERILDPVAECLAPDAARKVVAMRADSQTQARIDQLAEKANEGTLTVEERADYEKLRATFHVITILQSRARRMLQQSSMPRSLASRKSDAPRSDCLT